MRDIGKNLKQLREQKGLKQDELAELLFVTRQTVSNYENGRSRPDIETLMKIAEILEITANELLNDYNVNIGETVKMNYDVIIIGAGPAGLSAAIYMARAKYKVLVIDEVGFLPVDPEGANMLFQLIFVLILYNSSFPFC